MDGWVGELYSFMKNLTNKLLSNVDQLPDLVLKSTKSTHHIQFQKTDPYRYPVKAEHCHPDCVEHS